MVSREDLQRLSLDDDAPQGASELEAAGRDLLSWDARYPKDTIYNPEEHAECVAELTALIERFRELLAHNG